MSRWQSVAVGAPQLASHRGTPIEPVAGVPIQPELGAPVLPRSTREVPLFLLVYPTLASSTAELRLELLRDGQPVAQARPALPAPEPDGRIGWVGGLPAKSLAAGRYEIVATCAPATSRPRRGPPSRSARVRAYVATQYRAEPRLAMWVPSEMREVCEDVPGTWRRLHLG